MLSDLIAEFSSRLKEIAKDLSFLGHPRYPLKELLQIFPEHHSFINELEDVSVPFHVNVREKRINIDRFLKDLSNSELSKEMKFIFTKRAEDYHTLLSMLENFDNVFFYDLATKLYGTSHQSTQNNSFLYFIERIPQYCFVDMSEQSFQGEEALHYLKNRLLETFSESDIDVRPSNSLLSDSSAGRKTIKLNPHKSYTTQELNIFLVHEGWVHLGTSLNGASQEHHAWLSTWAPRTTFLQEGLAVLTELITGNMTHARWNKIILRHLCTSMAERGSNIKDVYSFLCHNEIEKLDALKTALRVFRGVPLDGGMAFTKELLYLHGLAQLLYHLQLYQIDLQSLWVGKMSFEEHIILLNQKEMKPTLRFFPIALEDSVVKARLKKLQDLAYSLFKQGFL